MSVQRQANYVLQIICIAFVLIAFKVAHLGIVQRETRLKEAEKPKTRTLWLRADRGEICDRFGVLMATNRICYNAAIYYAQIQQIPSRGWGLDAEGNKIRTFPKKEYIKSLAELLKKELSLDAEKIEDLIHAKASLLPHVPLIVKGDLTEQEYYRLKMLEKDFPGLHAEIGSERHYPMGKVGCHIIGTLGSISSKEYTAIIQEIRSLQGIVSEYEAFESFSTIPPEYESIDEVYERLFCLKDKAYTFNDRVGKSGVEGQFEEDLRGSWGMRSIEVDNQGKPICELSQSKPPIQGHQIKLSISAELQQFAEELLIQNESERDGKSLGVDPADKRRKEQKQPWIKGGAIVALDPNTGEVLTLASHPRFDPNDFIKKENLFRWLENEGMISSLWEGRSTLNRERGKKNLIVEEKIPITWEFYLQQVLPKEGAIKTFFETTDDIKGFVQLQEDFLALSFFGQNPSPIELMEALTSKNSPLWEKLRLTEDAIPYLKRLDQSLASIPSPKNRLFIIDLCRLCIDSPRFSDELLSKIGATKIATYRSLNQAFCRFTERKKNESFQTFHEEEFPLWRKENQKTFLAQKRLEEKKKKTYAKSYIDYLNKQEKELFSQFWEEKKFAILLQALHEDSTDPDVQFLQKALAELPQNLEEEWIRTFRFFHELDRPTFTQSAKYKTEKEIASAFYPSGGFGYCRSHAFQATSPQGSLFKLVTAYEGLKQGHNLSIIDEQRKDPKAPPGKQHIVAYSLAKTPYPRQYKGGRLPKTAALNVGKIDLFGALEYSSNPYFAILAGDYLKTPEDLNSASSLFGYGAITGIDLPNEAKGNLPSDLKTNRTGLYSYAIGQHTLLNTPLQSALMVASLANGGSLLKPQIVKEILTPEPIPTAMPLIRHSIFLTPEIQNTLIQGMDGCLWSGQGTVRHSSIRSLVANPIALHEYLLLQHQMVGKSSTTEIVFNPDAIPTSLAQVYKHIWIGSISFPVKSKWENPELVVIVFLRFGSAGRDAAPLAAKMIRKWREIQENHKK